MKINQINQIERQLPGGLSVTVKVLAGLLALAALPLQAADETWTGGNTPDFNWNTNANWSTAIPVTDDQLFFDGSVGLLNTNNISANTEFGGLTIKPTAGVFTLIGNAITLANGSGITNNSANVVTNRLTSAIAVTNSGIINYVTTPGGGKIVFVNQLNWANAAVSNSTLNFINANAVATGQFGTGGNNNSVSNVVACYGSYIDGANGRLNTANGIGDMTILDNTIATNFGGMVVGNGGAAFNTTVIITNGSKLYITGSDLFEVNRNTGAQGNKVIVTGPGSAWINRGTHSFALGGSSGNCTNAMVEVRNGAIWDLGGSTFRLNYNGPQNSIYANNGTLTNVYSMIIGNGNNSNSMVLANGSKFNFSGASGDFREMGRGNNANNNTLTITDPNTRWDNGGATWTIGGTATSANNYSNIMTIANGAVFTNGSLTVGGQGVNQMLVISNASAYVNTMIVNGNNSVVYLNGGSSDTVYLGTLGNNATGILTNTANTAENLVLGWNNGSQTGNAVPVMGGLMNITKTGTGSQNLQNANVFVGNILVTGGTLGSGNQQAASDGSFSAFGVMTTPGKTITITNGGTLNLGNTYALLNGLTPGTLPPITVYPGSTLNSSRFNAIGQITLNGGTLLQNSSDAGPLNGYQFYTNVTVNGLAASTISVGANGLPDDLYNAASGGTTFNVANTASGGADLTVSAGLADFSNDGVTALAGSLFKAGAGTMVSTGTNTYTGLTTVLNGELGFSSYSPQSGGIVVNDGAILDVTAVGNSQMVPATLTLGNSTGATLQFINLASTTTAPVIATNLTLNGTVTVNLKFPSIGNGNQYPLITYTTIGGSGHLALGVGRPGSSMNLVTNNNGDGTFTIALNVVNIGSATTDIWTGVTSGNWDFATANWTVGGTSATYFDGDFVVFTNGATRTGVTLGTTVTPGSVMVNSSSSYTFTTSGGGHIAGTGNLYKGGSGSLTLNGLANTYTGTNFITGGTVVIDSGANLGVVANPVILAGGALSASTTLALNVSRPVLLGAGTLDVASGQTLTIPGVLVDNLPATGSLTKTGAGTLNLSGANSYSGSTLVSSGNLITTTAQQGGGAITVGDTAALTVFASGGATLPTAGLTLGSSGNTTLTLQGASGTNAPITAANLTANGTVTVSVLGAATKLGEIPLIKYATFSSGSIANFALASTLPPNVSAVLTNDTSGKFVGLLITAINGLTWAGTNGPNWDIATTANWLYGASGSVFSDGSAVLFNDSGAKNVTIRQLVSPASMVVNNSATTYTFTPATGTAGIGGSGGFLKLGLGTMNYASVTNNYAGPTVIGGGQVALAAHPALSQTGPGSQLLEFSTNSVIITNNAFLQLAGVGGSGAVWQQTMSNSITLDGGSIFAQDGGQHLAGSIIIGTNGAAFGDQQINKFLYLDGPVSGSGTISVPLFGGISDGVHTPGGSGYGGPNFTYSVNPYVGTVTLYDGYIGIQDANGTCLANATLDLEGYNATFGQPVIWTANTTHAIVLGGLTGASPTMILNLTEPVDGWYVSLTVGNNTVGTLIYNGALSDSSASAGVTKVGSNAQWLVGTNTYPGPTMVNAGELGISTLHAGNGQFIVSDGASLGVTNMGGSISAQISSLTLGSSGATTFEFQRVADVTTPLVNCSGGLTVNGTGTVKITGTNGLAAGNTYPLIKYGSLSGGFALSLPANVSATLTNDTGNSWIALNVTQVGSAVNTSPTSITKSLSGGNLTLSWPTDHTGWRLEVQTNNLSVGLYTNWVTVANSTTTNSVTLPISAGNGAVFYRLVYP